MPHPVKLPALKSTRPAILPESRKIRPTQTDVSQSFSKVTKAPAPEKVEEEEKDKKKPSLVNHDFWLVAMIDVEENSIQKETTTARMFTKWHIRDPNFKKDPEKWKRTFTKEPKGEEGGQRTDILDNVLSADVAVRSKLGMQMDAPIPEHQKELYGAMMAAKLQEEKEAKDKEAEEIDDIYKGLRAQLKDEEGNAIEDKVILDRLRRGEMVKKITLQMEDSSMFPVNTQFMFVNQIDPPEYITALSWVQYHVDPTKPTFGTISQQLVFTVTLHTGFNMKEYPYDRHLVPFALCTRGWKEKVDGGNFKHTWVLQDEIPNWAPGDYAEDKSIVNDNLAWIDEEQELDHMLPCFFFQENRKPVLCIRLERNPRFVVESMMIPIWCTVWLCMAFFFFEFNNVADRANAVLISVLVAAAYKNVIQDMLPKKTYTTLADQYFLFVFFFHLMLMLKTLACFHLQSRGVGMFNDFSWQWYKIADGDHVQHEDWHTLAEYQTFDDATTWVLFVFWMVFHLTAFADVFARMRSGARHEGLLDRVLRPSWAKVKERCQNSVRDIHLASNRRRLKAKYRLDKLDRLKKEVEKGKENEKSVGAQRGRSNTTLEKLQKKLEKKLDKKSDEYWKNEVVNCFNCDQANEELWKCNCT